jgi:hypothetical protein
VTITFWWMNHGDSDVFQVVRCADQGLLSIGLSCQSLGEL